MWQKLLTQFLEINTFLVEQLFFLPWSVHQASLFLRGGVSSLSFFVEKFVWDTNSICETGIQSVSVLTGVLLLISTQKEYNDCLMFKHWFHNVLTPIHERGNKLLSIKLFCWFVPIIVYLVKCQMPFVKPQIPHKLKACTFCLVPIWSKLLDSRHGRNCEH